MTTQLFKGKQIPHWTWDSIPPAQQKLLQQHGATRIVEHKPIKGEDVTIFATMSAGGNRLRDEFLRTHPGEAYDNQYVYVHCKSIANAHIAEVKRCEDRIRASIGKETRPVHEVKAVEEATRSIRQFVYNCFICAIDTDKSLLAVYHNKVDIFEIRGVGDYTIRVLREELLNLTTMAMLSEIVDLADLLTAA